MTQLDLEMERFSHAGGIDGDGATRLLGRPKLAPFPLLVRESVQNSWDARSTDDEPVYFDMNLAALSPTQVTALRDSVFCEVPESHKSLRQWVDDSKAHRMLWISDRGTIGLRGPTRADILDENDDRNFCDLVRNLGRDKALNVGGGTYGYGKSALFRASSCSTVIFYSRIKTAKGFESRLMIGSWIGRFALKDGRRSVPHTGRMWWGSRASDGLVDPLLNGAADRMAKRLGATEFAEGTTGTTIGIVAPDLGPLTPEQAVKEIVSSMLWHCWPKMANLDGRPQMSFMVRLNSQPVSLPPPESCPPLDAYVRALKLALSNQDVREPGSTLAGPVQRHRPRTLLGWLGLSFTARRPRPPELGDGEEPHPVAVSSHHVALMRKPRLVVSYLPCADLATDMTEYGAVFIADGELERPFADSEPPSHDEWSPELMHDEDARSCVRVAIRRIHEQIADFLAPPESEDTDHKAIGLGAFSMMMGGLVAGIPGEGAENPGDSGGGGGGGSGGGSGAGGRTKKGKIEPLPAELKTEGKQLVALVPFMATPAPGSDGMRVRAQVGVGILDGSAVESEPPIGSVAPEIIGWMDPNGLIENAGDEVRITPAKSGRWHLKISIPDDVQVLSSLKVIA
jgi:hypothetical protein